MVRADISRNLGIGWRLFDNPRRGICVISEESAGNGHCVGFASHREGAVSIPW